MRRLQLHIQDEWIHRRSITPKVSSHTSSTSLLFNILNKTNSAGSAAPPTGCKLHCTPENIDFSDLKVERSFKTETNAHKKVNKSLSSSKSKDMVFKYHFVNVKVLKRLILTVVSN